jgi:hypothetical protein
MWFYQFLMAFALRFLLLRWAPEIAPPLKLKRKGALSVPKTLKMRGSPLHTGSWHNFHSLGDRKIPAPLDVFHITRSD